MLKRTSSCLAALAALCAAACSPQSSAPPCAEPAGPCVLQQILASPEPKSEAYFLYAFILAGDVAALREWVARQQSVRFGFALNIWEDLKGLSPQQALAAAALATAAYTTTDPYSDAQWLSVGRPYLDDRNVSRGAARLLDETGSEMWEYLLQRPPGYAAIARRIIESAPADPNMAPAILDDLTWLGPGALKPLARPLIDRIVSTGTTRDGLTHAARLLADWYDDPDAAEAAMRAAPSARPDSSARYPDMSIARARLRASGYDKVSAERLAGELTSTSPLFRESEFALLASANAHDELRRIGDVFLGSARADQNPLEAALYLSGAATAYRLAGDTAPALAAAREGMRVIPAALDSKADLTDPKERRREAGEDNGARTSPALALYLAGAEDEALASNYLSGLALLKQWPKPLDQFDPRWLVDDGPTWRGVIIFEVIRKEDRAFATRVYEAFLAPSVDSPPTEPGDLAILAATAGKANEARAHLQTMRQQADAEPDKFTNRNYARLRVVPAWRLVEMLLANQLRP